MSLLRVTKINFTNSQPTFPIFTSSDSRKWLYYQKQINQTTLNHTSLKLSFTSIRGLRLNFGECQSFLESNSSDILAQCETNLGDSINSGNFSVRVYLPLTRKDSITHVHGLEVYVKKGLPFVPDLSLETSADSYLCF